MSGISDGLGGSKQRARSRNRKRGLTQLNTRCFDGERDIDSVVDKELSVVTPAERRDFRREVHEAFAVEVFFAKLNGFDAAI
jgi:hypothetical protein